MQASAIKFYLKLAKGIAQQFGHNCEVVVHDLESGDLDSSIVAIENGHVSGRKIGDGPSHEVLEALKGDRSKLQDHMSYLTRTKDGRILKSSTIYIRDDDNRAIGVFAINYDITLLLSAYNDIGDFTKTEETKKAPEPIVKNVTDLLDELIQQSIEIVNKPIAKMNKEDKVKAIRFLNENGAFLITKSGDKVCKLFGISKYTLYSYMDEGKS